MYKFLNLSWIIFIHISSLASAQKRGRESPCTSPQPQGDISNKKNSNKGAAFSQTFCPLDINSNSFDLIDV